MTEPEMPPLEPKASIDMRGWTLITCWQAELVRRFDLSPVAGRTDTDTPDQFTEWWALASDKVLRSVPVLREYLNRGGCSHWLAGAPEEAARVVES